MLWFCYAGQYKYLWTWISSAPKVYFALCRLSSYLTTEPITFPKSSHFSPYSHALNGDESYLISPAPKMYFPFCDSISNVVTMRSMVGDSGHYCLCFHVGFKGWHRQQVTFCDFFRVGLQ